VWKAVKTKVGKVRMAEAKGGREKREGKKEIRRERTEKRRRKEKEKN